MELGFVGLGDQGGPIPRRLLAAGHSVRLWARRPEALKSYAEDGAKTVADLRSLAEHCDWIGICVFDDAGVVQVCDAIIDHMRPGSSIVVHSTVHPETCRTIADKAAARDLLFVDAPVSGGNAGASAGKLTIMVGAHPKAFAVSEPILKTYASLIVRVGEPGAGQAAKLINNMLMATHAGIAHAALTTGEALGLDRNALVQIVNASSGRSFGFEIMGAIGANGFAQAATILDKDVALLAETLGEGAPLQPYIALTGEFLSALRPSS